jgi:hypothetical protein
MVLILNVVPQIAEIIASMLSLALQSVPLKNEPQEEIDELKNPNTSSRTICLYLPPPIDDGSGKIQSGKHRTPICSQGQSFEFGMGSSPHQSFRWRLGNIRDTISHARGFQDAHCGCFFKKSGGSVCSRSIEASEIKHGLASAFGTLLLNKHIDSG